MWQRAETALLFGTINLHGFLATVFNQRNHTNHFGFSCSFAHRGGNQISYSEVLSRAAYARDFAGGAQFGVMLWSLHKNDGCPNAQQITQGVCTTYNLGNCNAALPVPVTANCPAVAPSPPSPPAPPSPPGVVSSSPPPPPSGGVCTGTAGFGGACGATNGGNCCQGGQCCSQYGWCGVTTAHCGAGCQAAYGVCT